MENAGPGSNHCCVQLRGDKTPWHNLTPTRHPPCSCRPPTWRTTFMHSVPSLRVLTTICTKTFNRTRLCTTHFSAGPSCLVSPWPRVSARTDTQAALRFFRLALASLAAASSSSTRPSSRNCNRRCMEGMVLRHATKPNSSLPA